MSLLEGLAQLAHRDGFGTYQTRHAYGDDDTGIVLGAVPASPDHVVALNLYAGSEADSKLPYDEPNVQVRVRGTDAIGPLVLAQDIYDTWHGRGPLTVGDGTPVLSIIGNQAGPIFLQQDDHGRHEYTINFRVEYRRTSTTRNGSN